MARFYHPESQPAHRPVFQPRQEEDFRPDGDEYDEAYREPGTDYELSGAEYDEAYDEDYDEDPEFLSDAERAALRRERWHILSNLWDFVAVIAGMAVVLVLLALIISLLNWLHADVSQTFTLWQIKI